MKKQYNAPVAEKMEFDYEENVVASESPTNKKHGTTHIGMNGNQPGCTKVKC